jgi:dienelactone hydrolase
MRYGGCPAGLFGILWLILIALAETFASSAPLISPFEFTVSGAKLEGYLAVPPGEKPKALILYFHRAIEDRTAANQWAEFLAPQGYAVACYTAGTATNHIEAARAALKMLRARKEFVGTPVIATGASMGSGVAAELFAEDPSIRALILLVPGNADKSCRAVAQRGKRPILLIQAEQDEIVDANSQKKIRNCSDRQATAITLPQTTHRFPISKVEPQILEWLKTSDH